MTALIVPTDAPVIAGPPQGRWTFADWQTLPDDGRRYEIIDGVLYMTTTPSTFHQWIVMRITERFGLPAVNQGLGYAFTALVGVLMPGCDPGQPDFLFVRRGNAAIIRNGRIHGVPDLIVEVLSPGNAAYDKQVNLPAYALEGVPECALIRPMIRAVSVYRLDRLGRYAAPGEASSSDVLTFDCLPGLAATVNDLFEGAPDTTF
ncbi:MAG: Uma2 family endonuclease [Roseiflexus sp.]